MPDGRHQFRRALLDRKPLNGGSIGSSRGAALAVCMLGWHRAGVVVDNTGSHGSRRQTVDEVRHAQCLGQIFNGELLRADTLVHLRCHDGAVEATGTGGQQVRLTGPGCPPDFHVQLLLELTRVNLDDRWIVIVSPEVTAEGAKWTRSTANDLVDRRADG